MVKRSLVLIFLMNIVNFLQAEYIVVKFDNEKQQFLPLHKDDEKDFAKIYQILLDYSWPTNLAKKDLLSNGHPVFKQEEAAEEVFIREMIKKEVGEQYDIVFIPTTVYELFVVQKFYPAYVAYVNGCIQDLEEIGSFGWLYLVHHELLANLSSFDYKIRSVVKDKKSTLGNVFEVYRNFTNSDNPSYNFIVQANFSINNSLGAYLQNEFFGLFASNKIDTVFEKIKNDIFKITANTIPYAVSAFNEYVKVQFNFKSVPSDFFDFESDFLNFNNLMTELDAQKKALNSDGIVAKTIVAEYLAREKNQGLLFRGTGLISTGIGKKDNPLLIDSLGFKWPDNVSKNVINFMKLYFSNELVEYSVSYGNSLFAGSIRDSGANAYNFIFKAQDDAKQIGYVLFIDKEQYKSNNLFFVAPLSTLAAIFSGGEFFHSRSKVGYTILNKNRDWIKGINRGIDDQIDFLFYNRDPLIQAVMLSNFIADHALILTIKDPKLEKEILKTHKNMVTIYQSFATLKKELEQPKKPIKTSQEVKQELVKEIITQEKPL